MSDVHLTVLDVGHGGAAVLAGPDGTVLIDAGPGPWVLDYLDDQAIRHLDAVAITHADDDHLKGLTALMDSDSVSLGTVRINSDAKKDTAIWDAITFSLDQRNQREELKFEVSLTVGDELPQVADGVTVEIVAPSKYIASHGPGSKDQLGRALTGHSVNAVLRIAVHGEPRVIVAGDIDMVGLSNLLENHDIRASVLVFPHHGGNVRSSASSAENAEFARLLCEAVEPETVIFSLGRGRYANPRPEIVSAIRSYGADVRIACTQLSTACAEDVPPQDAFTHLAMLPARGRPQNLCCAGTLRIPLDDPGVSEDDQYEAFKQQYAPSALCLASQVPAG